jgi:hypothetical protein
MTTPQKHNIIFSGDRNCKKMTVIQHILSKLDPTKHRIIQGGCKGVDLSVKSIARKMGFDVVTVAAEWNNTTSPTYSRVLGYDPQAGPTRNQKMLTEYPPAMVYLIHSNIEQSLGTKNMRALCRKHKIPFEVVNI